MSRALTLGVAVGCALVAGGVSASSGCSSSSTAPGATVDSGGLDGNVDSSTDDVTQNDSGNPPGDSSNPIDSGKDSAPSMCPDGGTPVHLPPGFTQVTASSVDPSFGFGVSMALDENDDPMLAYLAVQASVQSGMAPVACDPQTAPQGCDALYSGTRRPGGRTRATPRGSPRAKATCGTWGAASAIVASSGREQQEQDRDPTLGHPAICCHAERSEAPHGPVGSLGLRPR